MIIINCFLFSLLFLFTIYRVGVIVSYFFKKNNRIYNLLYGFIAEVGITQILLTPCILVHTSFEVPFVITVLVNIILIIISFIISKKVNYKKIKKDKLTIFVLIIVILQAISSTIFFKENADDSFYVSLSTESIDSSSIYRNEPSMGYETDNVLLSTTEQIPSIELQFAIYSKIAGVNPAILCHTIIPSIIIIITFIALYYFGSSFMNDKKCKIFLILLSVLIIFAGFSTKFRAGCLYIKPWQGKAIFLNIGIPIILGCLINLERKIKKKDIVILFLANLFSITLTSTAIFLVPFMYMPFGIIKLVKKKWKDILYLIITFMPIAIYICIYIFMNQNVEAPFDVPKDDVSIWNSIQYYNSYIYLIYYLISTIFIMIIGNKRAKKYFGLVQLINILTIWNPILSNLIAKYFTSSAIFWRVLWLMPIEYAIAYVTTEVVFKIKRKSIKTIAVIIYLCLIIIPGKFVYFKGITKNYENMIPDVLKTTNYILERNNEKEKIIVLGPEEFNTTMRQINKKIKLMVSRDFYIGKIKKQNEITERMNLYKLYMGIEELNVENLNDIIKKYEINYIIVNTNNLNLINAFDNVSNLKKDTIIEDYTIYYNINSK